MSDTAAVVIGVAAVAAAAVVVVMVMKQEPQPAALPAPAAPPPVAVQVEAVKKEGQDLIGQLGQLAGGAVADLGRNLFGSLFGK